MPTIFEILAEGKPKEFNSKYSSYAEYKAKRQEAIERSKYQNQAGIEEDYKTRSMQPGKEKNYFNK